MPSAHRLRFATHHPRFSRLRLRLEELETRTVPSVAGLLHAIAHPQAESISPGTFISTPHGYFPNQIRTAYGFDQIALNNANGQPLSIPADGQGQTVAVIDAYHNPYLQSDLATFSNTFGLPQANLTELDEFGNALTATNTPAADQGWGLETALDVEWIHALAPNARIVVFEANTSSVLDVFQGVYTAANTPGVGVVSMSFGISENFLSSDFVNFFDFIFSTPAGHTPVSFVAASGDDAGGLFDQYGNFYPAANYPSSVPSVLGVGGTSLLLNGDNSYNSESAWIGSGGGQSFFETEPASQNGVQNSGFRQAPDVAFDGDPNTGVAVLDSLGVSTSHGFFNGWLQVGGTSFGAPAWSALLSIANQGRAKVGLAPLGNPQADVYQLPSSDFHDITTGHNFANFATPGYDMVTGLGSPIAQNVVHDLVNSVETNSPSGHGNGYAIGSSNSNGKVQAHSITITSAPTGAIATALAPSAAAPTALQSAAPVLRTVAPAVANLDSFVPPQVHVTQVTHLATDDDGVPSEMPMVPMTTDDQPSSPAVEPAPTMPAAPPAAIELYDAVFSQAAATPASSPTVASAPAQERIGDFVQSIDPIALAGLAAVVGGTWRVPADDSRQTRRRIWRA